uniref:Uncharacterized protein n=1 Tax=Arundo donax TaxID=35708 RepID=A0A0A9BMB7_ARUDO
MASSAATDLAKATRPCRGDGAREAVLAAWCRKAPSAATTRRSH